MGFLFTGMWGAIWLGALVASTIITLLGRNRDAWGICAVMWFNWIGTRTIVTYDHDNLMAVILLDFATVFLLVANCNGRASKSVAALFAIIIAMDVNEAAGFAEFSQTAAMADGLGALMLVVMTGAAHVGPGGGKLASRGGRIWTGISGTRLVGKTRRETE